MVDAKPPTVVILTALPLEHEAVLTRLTDLEPLVHETGTRAKIGPLASTPWQVALVQMGEKAVNAAVLTERIITWLRPQALLFVGVAGSLKKDVRLGDVVIATKVYAYHGGKQTLEGFLARPDSWPVSHRLEQAAFDALGTSAHFKPIAAGDVVLDDAASELAEHIRTNYNDAVAIEMEGNGVAHAAHLSGRLDAVVIRGISDLANGRKGRADASGSQLRAAANAADAALAVLRKLQPVATATSVPAPAEAELPARYGGDHYDHRHNVNYGPVTGKIVNNYPAPKQP